MNIYKRILISIFILYFTINVFSQNRDLAQETIEELCSEKFAGRGYINDGDRKAAQFIANRFEAIGLEPVHDTYFQKFNLNVNTIPYALVKVGEKELRAGHDYLVSPATNSGKGAYNIFYVSRKMLTSPKVALKIKKAIKKGYLPVISTYDKGNKLIFDNIKEVRNCNKGATIVYLKESLVWSVSRTQTKECEIWILDSIFDKFAKEIIIDIKANFIENYQSQNVIGYVKGTEYPDSFVILCGHYDHLGKMGDAVFYGANDNASGISILLDMAAYFKQNPQKYSVAFIAFGGEEAGLIGSKRYVMNPPLEIPLAKTKFVFNMDLMGSGEDGATIVNGSVYKDDFSALVKINNEKEYLVKIKSRGKAQNSDHFYFSEAGVPSFFIYLMGEYKYYHVPEDNPTNLHLGEYYDQSFLLIRDFIIYLNQ